MAGTLPPVLGGQLPAPRRLARGAAGQAEKATHQAIKEITMKDAAALQVTTPSEREIAMTRVFNAPRRLVFDAWTKPELLKRWLGVRGGWSLAVCEIDLRCSTTHCTKA